MSESSINLHGIAAEIERVQEQLRQARVQASPADLEYLDTKIAQLQELHATTRTLCPKAMDVWGTPVALPAGHTPPGTDDRPAQH